MSTRDLQCWMALVSVGCLTLGTTPVEAQRRVYLQTFDEPSQVEDFWFTTNDSAKKVVGASDEAVVHKGNCLRGNWQQAITDPITQLTTADSVSCRYARYTLHTGPLGIVDEMFLDYWAYVDSNATKAYGAKWLWLEGSYKIPGQYGDRFNHILLPPWGGWDTWRLVNNTAKRIGDDVPRETKLSQIAGITALRQDKTVDEWFQGRWHHFQVHVKLNTPASAANGILKFWLDEVLVLDVDDYKYRDVDEDHINHFVTPHMYGGEFPPPGPFGWQLDELAVWDGVPAQTDAGVDQGMPQDAGADAEQADAGSSSDTGADADAAVASGDATTNDASGDHDNGSRTDAQATADGSPAGEGGINGGCGCSHDSHTPRAGWLLGGLLLFVLWTRVGAPRRGS